MAFSPDGLTVLTGSEDGTARLWETATGRSVSPPLHQTGPVSAAFSPDGMTIVTHVEGGPVQLWDREKAIPRGSPLEHRGGIAIVVFSSNGKVVLTTGRDKTARLWDAVTSAPLGPPLEQSGNPSVCAFSPDGLGLLTSGGFSEVPTAMEGSVEQIKLWIQATTGMELDPRGAVRELDAATWHARRQRLQALGGPPRP